MHDPRMPIFGLTVIVAANIWAVREPPQTEAQRSLSRAIEEILGTTNTAREGPPNAQPCAGEGLDSQSGASVEAFRCRSTEQTQALDED